MENIAAIKTKYHEYSREDLLHLVAHLNIENDSLRARLFAKRSEKSGVDTSGQSGLFDEIEEIIEQENNAEKKADKDGNTAKPDDSNNPRKRGGRRPLPKHLERVRIEHDLAESERICPTHQVDLIKIGEKVSEKLELIPATVRVIENVTFTYKCPCCSETEEQLTFKSTPREPDPIPKSFATPSLLSYVIVSKFQDALPLYRLEKIFLRYQIDLPRSTMARWMIACSKLAQPIINLMKDDLLDYPVIGCDETPIQVLKEENRSPEQKSYMWVTRSFDGKIILFDYFTGRCTKTATKLLSGYNGTIVCDGLKTYTSFANTSPDIKLSGCMAHLRRKFFQAEKAAKKAAKGSKVKASEAMAIIRELYLVERNIVNKSPPERLQDRQNKSKFIMNKLKLWMDEQSCKVLPKSLLGRAIHYGLGEWHKLVVFLDNEQVPIDNNGTENCIRPFVIGRSNWLFAQSPSGARASSNLYSLVESAKSNNLDPFDYLSLVFKELPRSTQVDDYQKLLPHEVAKNFDVKPYQTPK